MILINGSGFHGSTQVTVKIEEAEQARQSAKQLLGDQQALALSFISFAGMRHRLEAS